MHQGAAVNTFKKLGLVLKYLFQAVLECGSDLSC